ncbi:MAG: type II toxin-antitoxin system VapC family toxin [Candidatus Odinarchaeia archaeon]
MIRIIDTVVLVASTDPSHSLYKKALEHLVSVRDSNETYVPSVVLLEYDLVLKKQKISEDIRVKNFEILSKIIPDNKILPLTNRIILEAIKLTKNHSISYFDSLIAGTASVYKADIISTDHVFSCIGIKAIW